MKKILPLAAVALVGIAPVSAADGPATRIDIALSNFKFTPATVTLEHGQPYMLHITDTASGSHDLVAKAFFDGATVASDDRRLISKGAISFEGGQTIDIHLVAPQPGTYEMHCSHFMHSAFGMTGKIIVK
ncbi:cupredoxin domain-containing protein [Sphingomonas sp.]|uniref:cupredoxin domain-containing protein n=1 Tax=Sphingomonas sp. TaxID=28214 RepID=UPI003D6D5800